ncbi:hypothetical protein GGI15_003364 [Coemansia interrupta]|uniref:Uncharacterized protein n=1 Tax=Coemansia interrupta TaxID=1126814 RepID=A0A9W8HD00_9FUNG|nr:hypothetical protein GGI15_003364 [Coemansia interrupta]
MDKLIQFAQEHMAAKAVVDSNELADLIISANDDPTYESADPDVLSTFMEALKDAPTCPSDTLQPILEKLFPGVLGEGNRNSNSSNESDGQNQMVPELPTTSRGAIARSPMDAVRRTSILKSRSDGSPRGSASEGMRLSRKNLSKLDDKDMDAAVNIAKKDTVDSMARYATVSGRYSPPRPSISTNTERIPERYLTQSESDFGGYETPKADRRAVRMLGRTSPERNMPNIDHSPDSSFNATSPSRLPARDEETSQYIDTLHQQMTKLKKEYRTTQEKVDMLTERYEVDTNALRDQVQEHNADTVKARREIERLKDIVAKHQKAYAESEHRVGDLTVEINNSQTKTNEYKKQLDRRISELKEAESRLMNQSAQIHNLTAKTADDEETRTQLEKRIREMEYEIMSLNSELEAANEEKERVARLQQENRKHQADLESLQKRLKELSAHVQLSRTSDKDGDDDMLSDVPPSIRRRAKSGVGSLYDELQNNDAHDLSGVDDISYERGGTRHRGHSDPSSLTSTSIGDIRELDVAIRDHISKALSVLLPEDWIFLSEVWKRVGKCDDDDDSEQQLRSDVLTAITKLDKHGLKSAIRSCNNPKLDRIVNNVSRSLGSNSISHGTSPKGAKGASGLVHLVANGQHTTAIVILYSVVIFCLGIITASYLNIAQPAAVASAQIGMANMTMSGSIKGTGDSGMDMVRQILIVDDTPVIKHYSPLRRRAPRSRFGEILFYWMETLLWDDADNQVPT